MTRLSVNINDDCANVLRRERAEGFTATESTRRAISLLHFARSGLLYHADGEPITLTPPRDPAPLPPYSGLELWAALQDDRDEETSA